MPEKTDLNYAFKLPPHAAIKYFRNKGYIISFDWWETWQQAHSTAFTVAKAMRMDVLTTIRGAVDNAIANGITPQEFAKTLAPELKKAGWWGRQFVAGPNGVERVQLGSPHRLKTIFRVSTQTAYAAGRWKQFQENISDRPYLQYISIQDARTRPSHAALHGLVFRHDDPFWDSHAPPNGWNCRCRIRALSERDIKRRNLPVSQGKDHLQKINQVAGVNKRTGEVIHREGVTYRGPGPTGKRVAMTPDPGWSYNPGASTRGGSPTTLLPPGFLKEKRQKLRQSGIHIKERIQPKTNEQAKALGKPIRSELMAVKYKNKPIAEWVKESNLSTDVIEALKLFQTELLAKLSIARNISTPAKTVQTRGKAFEAIRRASTRFPDSWTRQSDARGYLSVQYSKTRGMYFEADKIGTYKHVWIKHRDIGDGAIRTDTSATAEHEFTHRLQAVMPELDEFFQNVHRRRTRGDRLIRLNGGGVGRKDNYYNEYQGREYSDSPNAPVPEVMTMAYQPLLGDIDASLSEDKQYKVKDLRNLLEKDPEMVELALGLLFYWRPQ